MSNFPKIFAVIAIIAFFSNNTQAQNKKVTFGVKAGLNIANVSVSGTEEDVDTKMHMGFQLGGVVDYAINKKISLQSGLSFTSKGFNTENSDSEDGYSSKSSSSANFNYLEIPFQVAYRINNFQIYAGPYIAFGIGGKSKSDYSYSYTDPYSGETYSDSDSNESKLKPVFGEITDSDEFADDEEPFNAFDSGLNFGIGYQVGPVIINAGYSLGFSNIIRYEGMDFKVKNRVITISATYMFGK